MVSKPVSEQGVKVVVLDTPKQILHHAKNILKDAKNPSWKDVPIDKQLEAFQDKYKEFGRTFPIVLRHIVQTKKLYDKVLLRYIGLCKHHPTHSMEEFQERQADYLIRVYKQENPRASAREVGLIKRRYIEDLKKEEAYMKKIMEEVQTKRKGDHDKFDKEKRHDLVGLINNCIKDVPDDITIDLAPHKPYMDSDNIVSDKPQDNSVDDSDDNLVLYPKLRK